jgi:hypothetical protein
MGGVTMPNAKILQTIVTPDASGSRIQLEVSDASQLDEEADIRITIAVHVPDFEPTALPHLQRHALSVAQEALGVIRQTLAEELTGTRYDQPPRLKTK